MVAGLTLHRRPIMYISATAVSYHGHPRLQPHQGKGDTADALTVVRNVTNMPQQSPAVRVVEGELLTGRDATAKDNLNRVVHTLRGSLDAGAQEQASANKPSLLAIQVYLENSLSQPEVSSGRSSIIDYMV